MTAVSLAEAETRPARNGHAVSGQRKPSARSKVTNAAAEGKTKWLDGVDKRGPVPRRFCDLVAEITSDLGGPGELGESQRQIIKRIASMSVWCESMECRMADGEEIDIDRFQRTSNSLRRLCETIGLRRVPKDVTPSLDQVMARHAAEKAAQARKSAEPAEATDVE
jgi:hypothetical protein